MERTRQNRNPMIKVFILPVSPLIEPESSPLEIAFVETHDIQTFLLVDQSGAVRAPGTISFSEGIPRESRYFKYCRLYS